MKRQILTQSEAEEPTTTGIAELDHHRPLRPVTTFTSATTPSILSRASTQPVEGEAGPVPVDQGVVQAETETDASGKKTPAGHDRRGQGRGRRRGHGSMWQGPGPRSQPQQQF